jgi:hypothetical protein
LLVDLFFQAEMKYTGNLFMAAIVPLRAGAAEGTELAIKFVLFALRKCLNFVPLK